MGKYITSFYSITSVDLLFAQSIFRPLMADSCIKDRLRHRIYEAIHGGYSGLWHYIGLHYDVTPPSAQLVFWAEITPGGKLELTVKVCARFIKPGVSAEQWYNERWDRMRSGGFLDPTLRMILLDFLGRPVDQAARGG